MEEDSIVISGISCRLPQADNVEEFHQNMMNGRDMVSHIRSSPTDPDYDMTQPYSGTIRDLTKFDAVFFGVPPKLADVMDPQLRMLMEATCETFVDAGVSIEAMRGSNTAVFIGCGLSEALEAYVSDPDHVNAYAPIGCSSAMLANRISYAFDLKGPSYALRNGDASSFLALERAVLSVQQGQCEAAVVGGSNLCLKAAASFQLMMLDLLSPDGKCCCCNEDSCGTNRGEGVVVMLIQKRKFAKRIYSTLRHIKCTSMKNSFYPSYEEETKLLNEVYKEADVDPTKVSYVEISGSCNVDADAQEVNSVADVCCKDREKPLRIGSVKTNVGNTETASGLVSILKVLMAAQEGMIPSNLHVGTPNQCIEALHDGRIEFLSERKRWTPGIVGVSCNGMGHMHGHCILDFTSNPPDANKSQEKRLAVFSATSELGVKSVLKHLENNSEDFALHSLLNENSKLPPVQHQFRGFSILNSKQSCLEIQKCVNTGRALWYVFSGMGSQWPNMGRQMMKMEAFKRSIMSCDAILQRHGVSLHDIIMNEGDNVYDKCLNSFLGIVSIQIALVDLLRSMGLEPSGIVGHSVGELGCGYADGSLTTEETVLAAYWRGRCILESNLPTGGMAAVGLTWKEAKEQCPKGVVPACHNTEKTVTISGPLKDVQDFVTSLKERGVFAREVNSSGVAFHSYFMDQVAPLIKDKLSKIIVPKKRSKRWISSSIPESDWSTDLAQMSSADYIANNVTHPVLFQEALRHIPEGAVVIEIAPHCLLQAVLKRSLDPKCTVVPLMKKDHEDNTDFFLSNVGRCYNLGYNINSLGISSQLCNFPVPLTTPNLSSYIRWDHSVTWRTPQPEEFLSGQSGRQTEAIFEVDISPEGKDHYILDHFIDGRALFPAAGYLVLGWKMLAKSKGMVHTDTPVLFKNVSIHRATVLPSTGMIKFTVSMVPATGEFEVCEGGAMVASGEVSAPYKSLHTLDDESKCILSPRKSAKTTGPDLMADEVYREFRLRGYEYGPKFCGILQAAGNGMEGHLLWEDNWVTFIDAMMQMTLLSQPGKHLVLPTGIRYLSINPEHHRNKTLPITSNKTGVMATMDRIVDTIVCGGVEMQGLATKKAPPKKVLDVPVLEEMVFVPYVEEGTDSLVSASLQKYCQICVDQVKQLLKKLQSVGLISAKGPLMSVCNEVSKDDDTKKEEDIRQFKKSKNSVLLQTLLKVNAVASDDNFMTNVKNVLSAFKNDLMKDMLLSNHLQARSIKPCIDMVVENSPGHIRVLEVQMAESGLYKSVMGFLKVSPGLHFNYTLAISSAKSQIQSEMTEMGMESIVWDIQEQYDWDQVYDLVVVSDVLHEQENVEKVVENLHQAVKDNGFLLVTEITHNDILPKTLDILNSVSKERLEGSKYKGVKEWETLFEKSGFRPVARKSDGLLMTTFLFRKMDKDKDCKVLSVNGCFNLWLDNLKEEMAALQEESKGTNLWLTTDTSKPSGIVGLVNCLKKEPAGDRVRCIYNMDHNATLAEIPEELKRKDLVMNILKNGQWGSFRHVPVNTVENLAPKKSEKCFLSHNQSGKGFVWSELPKETASEREEVCHVMYAALTSQDQYKDQTQTGMGKEFSGVTSSGRRVMGVHCPAVATVAIVEKRFLVDVPENWTLQEASCVLWSYGIAIKALVLEEKLAAGTQVLICDGHTDIGIAAVAVAMELRCDVFVTVPSTEKKNYLMSYFERLNSSQVLVVKENSFAEFEILRLTNGQGVELVMNTMLDRSVSFDDTVLSSGGRVVDFIQNNSETNVIRIGSSVEHHKWNLENIKTKDFEVLWEHLSRGIKTGAYRPIPQHCFCCDDIQRAIGDLEFMKGYHSKIVIKIRDEKDLVGKQVAPLTKPVITTARCNPDKVYIITGGLGGFGLELASWLVEKGARKLVLTSRSGIRTGYQARKVRLLKNQEVTVLVSTEDITSQTGSRCLIEQATEHGLVGGIFHLAMVLRDGMLENQTLENFKEVLDPKVLGTVHLDNWSRTLCKALDWFVVFSSVTSGRGNAGQSNYGYANSFMERICEQRQRDGFPGLAIQWGMIGDVGVAVEKFGNKVTAVGGTLPQRMSSCLDSMDQFLCQSKPVVSSFVPASVSMEGQGTETQVQRTLMESVLRVLGSQDPPSLRPESTLLDLGMDSLMGVEIKQIMETQHSIEMSLPNIRTLTVKKLKEMSEAKSGGKTTSPDVILNVEKEVNANVDLEVERPGLFTIPMDCLVQLSPGQGDKMPVVILHDLDGSFGSWKALGKLLDNPVYGVQSTPTTPMVSIRAMAGFYTQKLAQHLMRGCYLLGLSFGSMLAVQIAQNIQTYWKSSDCKIVAVDSSPQILPALGGRSLQELEGMDRSMCDDIILRSFYQHIGLDAYEYQIETSLDEKLRQTVHAVMNAGLASGAPEVLYSVQNYHKRAMDAIKSPTPNVNCDVILIRPQMAEHEFGQQNNDYKWKESCSGKVTVHTLNYTHTELGRNGETFREIANIIEGLQSVESA